MAGNPSNSEIADVLERIGELLEAQDANPHRVRAYRNGARTVRAADESVAELADEGRQALTDLPNIGDSLAGIIVEYVHTGRSNLLARLEGEVAPEDLFGRIPGIGDELAERVARELDIHSLEELERAAHDGRLEEVEGFGPKRVQSVRLSLAGMLDRSAQRRQRQIEGTEQPPAEEPSVATLLEIDAEYRQRAESGDLPTIAPKRFNPEGEAWLPIMHAERDDWNFTVLYSNTARAHELEKTHDWVVIYYERDGREEQATVVTESSGPLEGRRVVRGREGECRRYYERQGEI